MLWRLFALMLLVEIVGSIFIWKVSNLTSSKFFKPVDFISYIIQKHIFDILKENVVFISKHIADTTVNTNQLTKNLLLIQSISNFHGLHISPVKVLGISMAMSFALHNISSNGKSITKTSNLHCSHYLDYYCKCGGFILHSANVSRQERTYSKT